MAWDSFDLVVVRSTWDYWLRHDEFLAWTRSVPRLANDAEVIAWNTDKTYLHRLELAGVPIVPTTWVRPGDPFEVPDQAFVVKPTVSAAAQDTAAYPPGAIEARDHVGALHAAGRPVMLQPYVEAVDTAGETSVLVFDGEVSHAIRKAAILRVGDGFVDDLASRFAISAKRASPDEVALAEQVVEVVRSWGHELLYARVDLMPGPLLIELELTEPSLFLRQVPGSADRFAAAVLRWLQRTAPATPRS